MIRRLSHCPKRCTMIRWLLLVLLVCVPTMVQAQGTDQAVRLVAEIPALPYIQVGLDWYGRQFPIEVSAVPPANLGPKVASVAFTHTADVLLTRYSTFSEFMRLGMFASLGQLGSFNPDIMRQSDLILYQGEVVGVCFGDYAIRFIDRPCLGVFSSSPHKELATDFITVLKDEEPLETTTEGELKRIAESFFGSLFYAEDYASAFEFLYFDPDEPDDGWTREQFIDVMTHQWLYRRVDTANVSVNLADVVLVDDWVRPRDGMVFPQVGELYALAEFRQDPDYVWHGQYFVRYLLHWVPDGDQWKVLSVPYNLFE